MRILPLMVPLMVLALLILIPDREEPRGTATGVAATQENLPVPLSDEAASPPEVIWLSHDWIEVPRASHPPDLRDASRRNTFGIDTLPRTAECTDPGCRACLIDLVYGQEF